VVIILVSTSSERLQRMANTAHVADQQASVCSDPSSMTKTLDKQEDEEERHFRKIIGAFLYYR
jgi:hypothetical protein